MALDRVMEVAVTPLRGALKIDLDLFSRRSGRVARRFERETTMQHRLWALLTAVGAARVALAP
jgi:hypothetical protein